MAFDSQAFLKNTPSKPGVYRMFTTHRDESKADEMIYVGKASDLKKRLSSYFSKSNQPIKTQRLVSHIHYIETTVTNTESEALILEHNLIKEFKPRYNVLLRDDKSYPYIFISEHDFPRLKMHRGARKKQGDYFGPYPSAGAVRQTNHILQRLFKVRPCEDSEFANRSRPCLQYQIKRCKAPCVDLVEREEYDKDIHHVKLFLNGKSDQIINELIAEMDVAANELDYEKAAEYRDQISSLRLVAQKQSVSGEKGDVDIIAVYYQASVAVMEMFFIRGGRLLGNKSYYPKTPEGTDEQELLSAFLLQFYLKHDIPSEIISSVAISEEVALSQLFAEKSQHKVQISNNVRGERRRWMKLAQENAKQSHLRLVSSQQGVMQRFQQLQDVLQLDALPERLECFDISHTMGEATVASCVVFNHEGPFKSDYRRFNIKDITPGDDYAAMHQALERRYQKRVDQGASLPDVLIIDGGKGQVTQATSVMSTLGLDSVCIVGVSKGPERTVGEETLIIPHMQTEMNLPADHPAFHLIHHIRDEAHRFAITGHRAKRGKERKRSVLEDIEGLGPKRRQALLKAFGGLQGIQAASADEMTKISGISKKMAQLIYNHLH